MHFKAFITGTIHLGLNQENTQNANMIDKCTSLFVNELMDGWVGGLLALWSDRG